MGVLDQYGKSRSRNLKMGIAQRNHLYANCVLIGDYKTALAVLIDIAQIQGLYPDKKLVVWDERKAGDVATLTDAELMEIATGRTTD